MAIQKSKTPPSATSSIVATAGEQLNEGPQHVTVHGRDEVVVVAAEEFRRKSVSASNSWPMPTGAPN
jgi:hypothetical protein